MIPDIFTSERQLAFFEKQKHCNVKFIFNDQDDVSVKSTIEAHQLVLAMCSEVFETIFYGPSANYSLSTTTALLEISDVKISVFKKMLSAMYGKKIKFDDVETACEFYCAVHKYEFKDAIVFVENYLLENITPENAILVLENAENFKNVKLKDACYKIFMEHTLEVLTNESFLDAEISTVETIFKLESLKIDSEMDLVKALERYIQHTEDRTEIIEKLRPVVNCIRFLTLSFEQLTEVVSRYQFLSSDEVLDVMSCLLPKKDYSKMPKGLSTSKQTRHNGVDYFKMVRLLSEFYSPKFCPKCAAVSRLTHHPIWACTSFKEHSKKLIIKHIYQKYNHVSLMEYSYNDLKKNYQIYVDFGFVNKSVDKK